MALALAVLVASLLGSVHCAAMCGAFVCFYANDKQGAGPASHAAYNLGRLLSYLALGALAGALGGAANRAGGVSGGVQVAAVLAGALMVGWGVRALLIARGVRLPAPPVPAGWQRAMGAALLHFRERPAAVRALATGLLTTLLPCGWLYVFVVTAGGSGSALRGGALMLVFWAGTLPMMVSVGVGARRLLGPWREKMPTVSAVSIVALGLLSIALHTGVLAPPGWLHRLTPEVASSSPHAAAMPMGGH